MTPAEQDRRIAEEAARQDIYWLGKPASKCMEDAVRIKADTILTAIAEAQKPLKEDTEIIDWLEEDPSRMDAVLAEILFPRGRSFREACRAARAQEGKNRE